MTYTLIQEQVLGSAQSSVTFSTIPGTYNDLVLECILPTMGGLFVTARVNGDSGSNYSRTYVLGQGSAASSGRQTNMTSMGWDGSANNPKTGEVLLVNYQSYASSSVNKTVISRESTSNDYVGAHVNLWRSTAAITTTTIICNNGNFAAGCTFRLWGVS